MKGINRHVFRGPETECPMAIRVALYDDNHAVVTFENEWTRAADEEQFETWLIGCMCHYCKDGGTIDFAMPDGTRTETMRLVKTVDGLYEFQSLPI